MFFVGEYTCKSHYIKDLGDKVSINRPNWGTTLVRQNDQN